MTLFADYIQASHRWSRPIRWFIWRHADTGDRRIRPVFGSNPAPRQPPGWVFEREVPHNDEWKAVELQRALGFV